VNSRDSLHVPRKNDTCISNDNKYRRISESSITKTVKGLKISLDSTPLKAITRVKGDTIRKVAQQPISWVSLKVE